ncbi:MAG: redoxin domain-containing protein [Bacteroidales bacterium]
MKKIASSVLILALLFAVPDIFAQQREITTLAIGAQAPDFDLPGIDGKNYTLGDFDDYKILSVVFWANHCPTAQAYEDRLIAMTEEYSSRGAGFVAISPNSPLAVNLGELGYSDLGDDLDDMKIRAEDKGYNFPYLYDGDNHEASVLYGPVATPHIFIFDEERKLRYRGRIDNTENPYAEPGTTDAIDAIEALLEGREVALKETPSFGCSVKWSWNDEWNRRVQKEWAEAPVGMETIGVADIRNLIQNDSENLRFVNIWATWCGPCVIEFPELITIDRMYRGRDFEFISISADNPSRKDNVLKFLEKHEASNKNYLYNDTDKYALIEAVDKDWQGALPHSLLIAPGGEIIARYAGIIDPLKVRRDIVGYLGRYYADDK